VAKDGEVVFAAHEDPGLDVPAEPVEVGKPGPAVSR